MKSNKLEIAEEFIRSIRNSVQPNLDKESIDAIKHYLEYGE